jgi:hypothetical protein
MALTVQENTFISLDEANAYFATRPYSDEWTLLTESERELYLKAATHMLTYYVSWHDGSPMTWDTLPQVLKYAQCELAHALIDHNLLSIAPDNISQIDLLDLSVSIGQGGSVIPDKVWMLIAHLGQRIDKPSTIRLSR